MLKRAFLALSLLALLAQGCGGKSSPASQPTGTPADPDGEPTGPAEPAPDPTPLPAR